MEPENNERFNLKRFLITLGLVVLAAGSVGGATFYVAGQQADKEREASEKRIYELESRIDDMEKTQEADVIKDDLGSETEKSSPSVDPKTVINDFLTSYLAYIKPPSTGNTPANFIASSKVVTDAFRNSVKYSPQIADPIILAQNFPDRGFTIGEVKIDGNSATATVTLNFSGAPATRDYYLVNVNNEWRIDKVLAVE